MLITTVIKTIFAHQIKSTFYLDTSNLNNLSFSNVKPTNLVKRQSFDYYKFATKSFNINLKCVEPYGGMDICLHVGNVLIIAAEIIENQVALKNRVTIESEFQSFCEKGIDGMACENDNNILASAAPYSMHLFEKDAAIDLQLDYNYGYPTALARQYIIDQDELELTDIVAYFNSDYNWYLDHTKAPNWGDAISIKGGFYNQSEFVSYDLEQIAVHEFLHGLGFISSWCRWAFIPDALFPSYPAFDYAGNVVGMLPSWIFTRTISDSTNSIWLRSYSENILASLEYSWHSGGYDWINWFIKTSGYEIAKSMLGTNGLFETPLSLLIWYPKYGYGGYEYAYLNVPKKFSSGSSIGHLDMGIYNGISDGYIMRPTATPHSLFGEFKPSRKQGLGDVVLGIFQAMGYVVYR
jgi:hypothetical protein